MCGFGALQPVECAIDAHCIDARTTPPPEDHAHHDEECSETGGPAPARRR
jgi:hypothetical protein